MSQTAGRDIDELLSALEAELSRLGSARLELCVIGGTALNVLGVVSRPTKDVDVVAIKQEDAGEVDLVKASPLPDVLAQAVDAVARQFGIEPDWLNAGPADLIDHGLPDGFEGRLVSREYGQRLCVHYAGRLDQVCFKVYAAADSAGRHLTDLLALEPDGDDLAFAFEWVTEQDASEAFRVRLRELADYLGVPDVSDGG